MRLKKEGNQKTGINISVINAILCLHFLFIALAAQEGEGKKNVM
jgi:hypothetical protein